MRRREFLAITACAACGAIGVGPATPVEEDEPILSNWKGGDWPSPYRVALETSSPAARNNIRKVENFSEYRDTAFMDWSGGRFSPDIEWLRAYAHELDKML